MNDTTMTNDTTSPSWEEPTLFDPKNATHIVHISIYAAVASVCVVQGDDSTLCFRFSLFLLALWLVRGEIQYVLEQSRMPPGASSYHFDV